MEKEVSLMSVLVSITNFVTFSYYIKKVNRFSTENFEDLFWGGCTKDWD